MTSKVYTVGHAETYRHGIAEHGDGFTKLGRRARGSHQFPDGYPGGYALASPEDARRLIEEEGRPEWAVFELAADWDEDTAPSQVGWWHSLLHDAVILREVEHEEETS